MVVLHWVSQRHLTAIERPALSMPARLAWQRNHIRPHDKILDFGCGRGGDVRRLQEQGFKITGYDPYYLPVPPQNQYDVVFLFYVINVIENLEERIEVLRQASGLARQKLIVATRLHRRGCEGMTRRNTFQKYFTKSEFLHFVALTLRTTQIEVLNSNILVITNGQSN